MAAIMMRNTAIRSIAFAAGIAILALAVPAPRVLAATWYWNTNITGLWTTTSNWSDNPSTGGTNPSTAPTTGDTAYFNQSSKNGATTLRLSADQSIDGLVFANTGATTITGTTANRILTIGTVGITINSGAGAVTLGNATSGSQVAIAMGGSQTWANNSSNTLTATNGITSTSGTQTLTIGGSGATALGGIIADGAAGNRVSITKQGAGNLTLSAANTFSGGLTVNAGIVSSGVATGFGAGAITLGDTSGSNNARLDLSGAAITYASNITVQAGSSGTMNIFGTGNGSQTLSGNIMLNRNVEVGQVAYSNQNVILSGSIGGTGGLIVSTSNLGQVRLTGSTTFSGGVTVNAGSLTFGNGGTINVNYTGPTTINGGTLIVGVSGTFDKDVTNNGTLQIIDGQAQTLSGVISGTGNLIYNGVMSRSNVITGTNNSYTGRTDITSSVQISKLADLGVNSSLGAPTSVANGTINLNNTNSSNARINYVGSGDTSNRVINFLSTTNANEISSNGSGPLVLTSNLTTSGGVKTLILSGTNTGNNTIQGIIPDGSGATSLTKSGAGTWVLTGANSYTGKTVIQGGALSVATIGSVSGTGNLGAPTTAANGTIDIGSTSVSGTLVYTGSGETTDRVINLLGTTGGAGIQADNASGTLIFSNNLTVTGSGAKALTLSGSGAGQLQGIIPNYTGAGGPLAVSVTKSGNGTWTLSGANSYTGATTVSAGVLRLDAANALPGGIASTGGSSALTINGGVIGLGNGDFARGLGSGTNQVQITGGGGFAAYGADRTVNLGGNGTPSSLTWGSGNFISAGSGTGTFILGAADATNMVDFQNPIALGSLVRMVRVDDGSAAVDAKLSGVLSSVSAGNGLTKTGAGTLDLTAANSFTGTLAVQNGTVRFSSLAVGSGAQNLGAGTLVNLGVAATSAGEIDYRGSGGTLDKNITALGSGRNRIRNSGAGTLTLSGTLTKDGTILELASGTFAVSGRITGATVGTSDLFINNAAVTLSNANNDYNGPTYVYGNGSLTLGASNVIPAASSLILGGTGSDTGTGTFNTGLFSGTIASLTTGSLGATIGITGSGATMGGLTMGNLTFGAGTDTLALTLTNPSLVRYTLLTYTGVRSGMFDTVTGAGNYNVVYGATSIDLQMKANQSSTFTLNPAAARVLVGGSTQLSGVLANSSPTGAASLAWSPVSSGSLSAITSSLGSTIASGSTSTITAWISAGNTAGTQTWSITNTDNNAITTVSTATGSITVVDQRVFTTPSISFGRFLNTAIRTGTSLITSTGSSNVTASSTIGLFANNTANGLTLSLNSGTNAFTGLVTTQTATYTTGGSWSGGLGSFSNSFTGTATNEFGGTSLLTVNYTGTAVQQRVFSSPSTINLGRVLLGASPVNSGTVMSTALSGTTANSTLQGYSGSAINGLSLSGGGVLFNGETTSAAYSLTGSVTGTAGNAIGGTFNLDAIDEFNNTVTNAASVVFTGTAVAQRSFSVSNSGTISLGNFLRTTAVTGSATVSSSGLLATTATASLGAFSSGTSINGFSLTTSDPTAFNGGTFNQSALYTLSGSAASAGGINGTFTSLVSAELGSIDPVTVSLVGTAYDPATASFNALSTLTSGTVDIGSFNQNTGLHTQGFSIFNLFSDPAYTADLTLLSITDLDTPSNSLSIDLTPALFGNLQAGGTSNWVASLSSLNVGSFTNRYQLNFESSKNGQSLGGPQSMTLTVTGIIVVPEPGAIALAGIGIAAAAYAYRRRRK